MSLSKMSRKIYENYLNKFIFFKTKTLNITSIMLEILSEIIKNFYQFYLIMNILLTFKCNKNDNKHHKFITHVLFGMFN